MFCLRCPALSWDLTVEQASLYVSCYFFSVILCAGEGQKELLSGMANLKDWREGEIHKR